MYVNIYIIDIDILQFIFIYLYTYIYIHILPLSDIYNKCNCTDFITLLLIDKNIYNLFLFLLHFTETQTYFADVLLLFACKLM